MRLRDYLARRNLTLTKFAAELGVSPEAVRRYVSGLRVPRPEIMARIVDRTGGAVQPNDFFLAGAGSVSVETAEDVAGVPAHRVTASEVLTTEEMYRADSAAMSAGIAGLVLMENAGAAVVHEIMVRWRLCPVVVLCGPGNNGGDGYVIARLLADAGWPVQVSTLVPADRLKGDAAANASRWNGAVVPFEPCALDGQGLVVDALFGAGLVRPIEGMAAAMVAAGAERGVPCVAVDIPSGVDGNTGVWRGAAAPADLTVTFFRKKPGHLLLPGREFAGEVAVADIGIPDEVLAEIRPRLHENGPALWLERFPWPGLTDHKYSRGHAVVFGGGEITGAARLAARAAQRSGGGAGHDRGATGGDSDLRHLDARHPDRRRE